eukprot:m51a1_g14255 hypothetical protein (76) ;mRNA; r:276887-277193
MADKQQMQQIEEARETFDIAWEVSRLLNTGLDRESLGLLVRLCEANVNPEALAAVVRDLRRRSSAAPPALSQQRL